jgi:hypothetical protein
LAVTHMDRSVGSRSDAFFGFFYFAEVCSRL